MDILLSSIGGGGTDDLSAVLGQIGFNVVLAEDAQDTVSLATDKDWDMVLLDIGSPSQTCFGICLDVREMTNAPLVILSAAISDEDLVMGLRAGADEFIVKPVPFAVLVARVHALLRRTRWSQQEEDEMEHKMDGLDVKGLAGLSPGEVIMLSCSYTLQTKGKPHTPPYKLFQIPGGAYLVETPRTPGSQHISLVLTD